MDSPFSALVEWVTSPQVVGSFVLGAVGLAVSTILLVFSFWADKRGSAVVSCALCIVGVLGIGVTVVCLCAFNTWLAGVQ